MHPYTVIKGCEVLKKLQIKPDHDHNLTEFLRKFDTTTKQELMQAIEEVLSKREQTVSNEIKAAVNE